MKWLLKKLGLIKTKKWQDDPATEAQKGYLYSLLHEKYNKAELAAAYGVSKNKPKDQILQEIIGRYKTKGDASVMITSLKEPNK